MLAAGVSVGLGTDGAASNNDLDLWEEIRMAALLHKMESGDPTALPARDALAMATRVGARAARLGDQVGQLKPGMRADLIQVELNKTQQLPLYDVISHLVYVVDSNDVVSTVVDGRVLMEERKVLTIDEEALRNKVQVRSQEIREALAEQAAGS